MSSQGVDSTGWLDTNVILRFLLNDHPDHSAKARALIGRAERGELSLHVPIYILCETVYVLESRTYTKSEVSDAISLFLAIPGIHIDNLPLVQTSLTQYRNMNVDFGDALLYSQCADEGGTILTFNKRHFSRLGNGWREP